MDPQQRLTLEAAWESLEDAGIVPADLHGSATGVFIGAMWQDYPQVSGTAAEAIEQHSAVGWNNSIIPARIAYCFGLRGPALTVNTACSSSLVAVHLACNSLRNGECNTALAGGVNLMLTPHGTVQMTKFGAMNPDGECRAFDADASGYVRGEGCAVVVLKRLRDALKMGVRIYAVIRGSSINNDGPSNGLTAPSVEAQAAVLRSAWAQAGVSPAQVSFVETHGPGTILGDPIEASALGEVFAPGRITPLQIGSVKTNLGHLEAAAGMAGLFKTALALHRGELPPNLHFATPNPHIDFQGLKLRVVSERSGFPSTSVRYAGVSSFGFGGTNSHVALSEAPGRPLRVAALAADSVEELRSNAKLLAGELLDVRTDADFDGVATRCHGAGRVRAILKGRHPDEFQSGLRQLFGARSQFSCVPEVPARRVFVFGGQGGQWAGMVQDLLSSDQTFSHHISTCDGAIRACAGWSIREVLALPTDEGAEARWSVDRIQVLVFSVQVALARTLMDWGLVPDAVIGQSLGEVAAAVISGALLLDDGARVIVARSLAVSTRSGQGAMAVVDCTVDEATPVIARFPEVSVAVHLSPRELVLSGPNGAMDALLAALAASGCRCQRVAVDYASHCAEMDPLLQDLEQQLTCLKPQVPRIPMWSTVHDGWVADALLDARYWCENLRSPVLLSQAITKARSKGFDTFIEIGPHPVTLRSIQMTLEARTPNEPAVCLPSCWRGEPAGDGLRSVVATCWLSGAEIDWDIVAGRKAKRASSPIAESVPLVVSGRDEAALRSQAGRWSEWLGSHPQADLAAVIRTAAVNRTHFDARAAIHADDIGQAQDALEALAQGRAHPAVSTGTARLLGGVVFVFPGQGSQWPGMGRALLAESAVFADAIAACDAALLPHTGWSVRAVLGGDDGEEVPPLDRVDVVQPVLFAMAIGLAAVWRSLGVRPDAVIGHSQGEIAAAVVAGALSLEDGARIAAVRSKLVRQLAGGGGMAVVELPVDAVEGLLERDGLALSIAVVNTPTSTVVSGDREAIEQFVGRRTEEGVFCRRVDVDYASHSAQVDGILGELKEALHGVQPRAASVGMFSTVTGEPLEGTELDAQYWCRNLRQPVRLDRGLDAAARARAWRVHRGECASCACDAADDGVCGCAGRGRWLAAA